MNSAYRQQLRYLADALSSPRQSQRLAPMLAEDSSLELVQVFVEGNLDKRLDKLADQLALVSEAFDEWDSLMMQYIRARLPQPYDTGLTDGERMLVWLSETQSPDDRQRDYLTCQQARHEIEHQAERQRAPYLRFQELRSLTADWLVDLEGNSRLKPVMNPIRRWSRLLTDEFLGDETPPPADVLFFAVDGEIATAVVELEGTVILNELADYQPDSLDQWRAHSALCGDALMTMVREFAELGIIAFQ